MGEEPSGITGGCEGRARAPGCGAAGSLRLEGSGGYSHRMSGKGLRNRRGRGDGPCGKDPGEPSPQRATGGWGGLWSLPYVKRTSYR